MNAPSLYLELGLLDNNHDRHHNNSVASPSVLYTIYRSHIYLVWTTLSK